MIYLFHLIWLVSSPKKDGEERLTNLAMHSSLGLGTVPLDLTIRDKLGGDGGGQTKRMFRESTFEHPKTQEVGGSRKPHRTEERLALRW